MIRTIKLGMVAAAFAAVTIAAPASAGTIVLSGSNSNGSTGNERSFSDGETSVVASGWSIDSDGKVREGALGQWSHGLGVMNSSGDNSHTVDNSGRIDFVLLQFAEEVILDTVTFNTGWHGMYDTDATIGVSNTMFTTTPDWNYVAATSALAGYNFFEAISNGGGSQTRGVNPSGFSGNSWIIAASASNYDHYKDGFKLAAITFQTVPTAAVPEPGTWALMLVGFGFAGGMMRRRKQVVRSSVVYA